MTPVMKHLLQPISFYLGQSKPHWCGTPEEEGHMATWEALFGDMEEQQLKYLAKYYMQTVYPQIRSEIQRSRRVYFPSPADMQSYVLEIKDEKSKRKAEEMRKQIEESQEKKREEERKAELEQSEANQKAFDIACEYLKGKDEKKVQYAARCFRFDSMGLPKEGFYWDITKTHKADTILAEIIKSGKFEEFKKQLDQQEQER